MMEIETRDATRGVSINGLHVVDESRLPMDRDSIDPDDVTYQTPGIKFFAVGGELSGNSPTEGGITTILIEYGIDPQNVVEVQSATIDRKRTLEIEP